MTGVATLPEITDYQAETGLDMHYRVPYTVVRASIDGVEYAVHNVPPGVVPCPEWGQAILLGGWYLDHPDRKPRMTAKARWQTDPRTNALTTLVVTGTVDGQEYQAEVRPGSDAFEALLAAWVKDEQERATTPIAEPRS